PSSGVNNSFVSVICESNNSLLPRTDKMVIKGTGVDSTVVLITQNGALPTFTISPQNISFTSGNQSQKISIVTNTSWKVFKNVDFINTNVTTGSGNASIEVTSSLNSYATSRTGLLKFLPNGMDNIFVKISQAGNAVSAYNEVIKKYSPFQVFPNPILNDFITLRKTYSLYEESTTVSLYQVNGHLIKSYQVPIFSEELILRLPQLSSGTYLLVVRNGKNKIIQSEKLVK
ncbi:MAG: T9SS type A sorting domain-containing protein, partial [Bacteroidota bacterium]